MSHDVFVSYSTDDKQVADTLVAALEQHGIRCWYAPRDIRPGADWGDSIFQGILKCEVFLLVFSGSSNRSHRVLDELNLAIEEEKVILPFRIENINPSGALRLHLTTRHWLDAFDPSWNFFLDQLTENVGANLKKWRPKKPVRAAKPTLDAASVQLELDTQDISGLPERQADLASASDAGMRIRTRQQDTEIPSPRKKSILLPIVAGLIGVAVLAALFLRGRWSGSEALAPTPLPTPEASSTQPTTIPVPTATADLEANKDALTVTTWTSGVDGMLLVYVPEGEFVMGSKTGSSMAQDDEFPQHRVYLDAFWVDQTEVSNGQYQQCVEAGGCDPYEAKGSYSRDSYYDDSAYADYPVIYVNWQQAQDYCLWAGRRLPTEAEWEKAARGTDERIYPWGDTTYRFSDRLNYCDKNCEFDWKDSTNDDGYADTAPVGSYSLGASPYGALDIAGNVFEWTVDWYDANYYDHPAQLNPTGPESGDKRVLRGGGFDSIEDSFRTTDRDMLDPGNGDYQFGFRCVDSDMDEFSGGRKTRTIDDMHLLFVPAGEFLMGTLGDTVELDAFYIDEHEVTVHQYKQCENNGPCTEPAKIQSASGEIYYRDTRFNDYPVINVNWDQAQAYCQWVGRRLPTEAEWEKAARGTDGRKFPWGDEFDGNKLNFCDTNCVAYDYRDINWDDGFAETSPVGSFWQGASPYDALDMAGNVWEWVADWYEADYYSVSPAKNPQGPNTGSEKVLRGGCWGDVNDLLETSFRHHVGRYISSHDIGFRCANDFSLPE